MNLPRVLEPEWMDSPEEAAEYDAMDHTAVNQAFVDDLVAAGFAGGDVLDLGTGTSLIPIALCRTVAECRVMAADAAAAMLDLARFNLELHGLSDRVQLEQVDAKCLPYPEAMFPTVISNSLLHHVPEPGVVVREAFRVTAPGGLLFFRDLLRPASVSERDSLVQRYAAEASTRQRELFAASLQAALSWEEVCALVAQAGFAPDTVQRTSDRHWTWVGRK